MGATSSTFAPHGVRPSLGPVAVLLLGALLATCRVDQLIAPSTATIRLIVAADTVGIADTTRLVARVTVDGKQNPALRVKWSTDLDTVATVDTTGLVRGIRRGTATITARVENELFLPAPLSASAVVRAVVPVLALVADSSVLRSVGDTVCITPVPRDAAGNILNIPPDSLRPDSVFIAAGTKGTAHCFLAPRGGGPVAFRAWLDTASARTSVAVRQVAETLTVAPDSVHFNSITQTESLTVTAADQRGNPITSPSLVWTSVDTTVTVSSTGVVTARFNGATWVRAADTAGTGRDSVRVVVRQEARRVTVTPDTATLTSVGARQPLQATALDALGRTIADAAFSWANLAPNTVHKVAENGAQAEFEAAAEGTASISITASAGGVVADTLARLQVRFGLTAVTISPAQPTLSRVGDTLRFSATGTDVNGATVPNLQVSWSSSDPANVSIDPASGLATTRDSGIAVIHGRHDSGVEGTTTATVAPPVLVLNDASLFADSALRSSTDTGATTRVISNGGTTGPLGVRLSVVRGAAWLQAAPDTATVASGGSISIRLTAAPGSLAEGTYRDTVRLRSVGAAGSPRDIPVRFTVYCQVDTIAPDAARAANLTATDCGARHQAGSFADYYRFTGVAGDTIRVALTTSPTSLDTYLYLLDSAGAVVASNDNCPGAGLNSCLQFVVPAAGPYTIEATSFAAGAAFAYTLGLTHPLPPAAAATLRQFVAGGGGELSPGATANTGNIEFRATGQDPNPRDSLRLEVEVKPLAQTFNGTQTLTGAPTPNAGGGVTLSRTVSGLTSSTDYHWRARVLDQTGRAGPWTSFAAGPGADFRVFITTPELTVSPTAVSDSAPAGSVPLRQTTIQITNTGNLTFTWHAATDSLAWVGLSPDSGAPGTSLTISLNPAGKPAGTYKATVSITAPGAVGSPATIPVTFEIRQPVLVVTPAAVSRSTNAGSGAVFFDTLRIANGGTGSLSWTATKDSAWLSLGKTLGGAPDQIPLTITTTGLAAGTHTDTVRVTASGATGSPAKIPVAVTVQQPVLFVSPASVTDSANYGTTAPRNVTLQITNTSGGTLTWSAAESPDTTWLSILPPPSGSAPGTVTLRLDPNPGGQLLAPGTHSGTVVFTSPEAINDPINVPVQFRVPRPILNVTPNSVFDTVTLGATTPRTIPVTIANGNGGTLAWTAGDSAPTSSWLSLSPPSGGAPGTLMVILNPMNLSGGVHRDTVVIRSDSATGSPLRLPVRFDVLRPPSPPTSLEQRRTAGAGGTTIADSGVTTETSVVFRATVTDPDAGDQLRLELQVEKVGTLFNATEAVSAPVSSGQTATVTFGAPFEDNSGYHWRVRTCDQTNRCSGWVSFGAPKPETAVDFFANPVPQDPAPPTQLKQFKANGTDSISVGGTAGSSPATVVLEALVTDPDPGDLLTLEVEVKSTDLSFNATGLTGGAGVTTGNKARATKTSLNGLVLVGTNYYWRARACDQTGRCSSTWVSYGGNSDVSGGTLFPADTDFHVNP